MTIISLAQHMSSSHATNAMLVFTKHSVHICYFRYHVRSTNVINTKTIHCCEKSHNRCEDEATHCAHTDSLGLVVEGVAKRVEKGQQQLAQVVL